MKNTFLKLLTSNVFFLTTFLSFSNDVGEVIPRRETMPASYYITKCIPDKKLSNTKAQVIFNFSDINFNIIKQTIKLSYNSINKTEIPDTNGNITIKVKPGKYVFSFYYNEKYFEITTDTINIEPAHRTEIKVNFQPADDYPRPMKKPVIYVYPKKPTEVNIKLNLKGKLDFTYPKYNNGWNFIADADGTIHINDKKYHYLFWEGTSNILMNKINWNEGFIVNKNNLIEFFEEKLLQMGLKSNEIEDYITYWCPLMAVNESNYIHFIFNEEYNEYASLTVTPKPDIMFRVFMMWSKTNQKENLKLKEQTIQSFTRAGFSVVEWGGTEFNENELPTRL